MAKLHHLPRRGSAFESLEPRRMFAIIGDANGDSLFDSSDLTAVFQAGEYEDGIRCNSTFDEGDWNNDCEFSSADLVLAFQEGAYAEVAYPRLFFGPEDVVGLREKIKISRFAEMFSRELAFARSRLTIDYSNPRLFELQKAEDAARISFVVLMLNTNDPERSTLAGKSREILRNINEGLWDATGDHGNRQVGWNGDEELHHWYSGGILIDYSAAYDWMVGAGELSGRERGDVRFRILRLAQMEHEIQMTPDHLKYAKGFVHRKSNYGLRSFSGVGVAALTFPEQTGMIADPLGLMDPAAAKPFNSYSVLETVLGELFLEITTEAPSNPASDGMIEHYVSPDGYYGEGFLYQHDVFTAVTPFLVALDNITGLDFISEDGVFDGRIAKMYTNQSRVMLPNYHRPTNGDSFYGTFYPYVAMVAPYTKYPEATYWYDEEVIDYRDERLGISMASFREDQTPLEPPDFRTEFMMDTGLAVFRDQFGPDATYMMMVARHQPVCGHNQADQGSLLLYAHGTYLVIDPGYGGAYSRDPAYETYVGSRWNWMTSSLGHSGITIDSVYPVDRIPKEDLRLAVHPRVVIGSYYDFLDPAHLQDPLAARDIDYVMAEVDYEVKNAQLNRAVAFPRHRYFVLEDVMTADAQHQYGWQLHLGDSTTGKLTKEGADYIWTTKNPAGQPVGLKISMLGGNRNVNVYDNGPTNLLGYSFPDQVFEHTYMLADETAEDTRYLTLLDPHYLNGSNLTVEPLVPGRAWKIVHSPTEYDIIVSQSESSRIKVDHIETDATFMVASVDIVQGQATLRSVMARGGNYAKASYKDVHDFALTDQSIFHYESSGQVLPD